MRRVQTIKLRVEIGPGMPATLEAFDHGNALKATLMGLFQLLTAEKTYARANASITASFEDATVQVMCTAIRNQMGVGIPTSHVIECEASHPRRIRLGLSRITTVHGNGRICPAALETLTMTGGDERKLLERIARATEQTNTTLTVISVMVIAIVIIAILRLVLDLGRLR